MVSLCVCTGWIGEWLHFPGSPNKTKVLCVCFGVLCVFTLLLNNTTSLINRMGKSYILNEMDKQISGIKIIQGIDKR